MKLSKIKKHRNTKKNHIRPLELEKNRLPPDVTLEELSLNDPGDPKDIEEIEKLGDPNFQSELDYDGYSSLEESDNDSYNSLDLERNDDTENELRIIDREEDPDTAEENLIDPQENRK